jgi:hypothetical protein
VRLLKRRSLRYFRNGATSRKIWVWGAKEDDKRYGTGREGRKTGFIVWMFVYGRVSGVDRRTSMLAGRFHEHAMLGEAVTQGG